LIIIVLFGTLAHEQLVQPRRIAKTAEHPLKVFDTIASVFWTGKGQSVGES